MNAKELYDHITKHMTPEQALLKLLEGTVISYQRLRFPEGEEIHPTILVASAALEMGWQIAIPDGGDNDELIGMAIGTPEYFEQLFSGDDSDGCCDDCDGDCSCNDNPPDHYDADEN